MRTARGVTTALALVLALTTAFAATSVAHKDTIQTKIAKLTFTPDSASRTATIAGKLSSDSDKCLGNRRVEIQYVDSRGLAHALGDTTTNDSGKFEIVEPLARIRQPADFRAEAAKKTIKKSAKHTHACGKAFKRVEV